MAPSFVSAAAAQDTTAVGPRRTHVVRPGDTLWELARVYLNDPWQWKELFRLNASVVRDPHWIFPGQSLALPNDVARGSVASPSRAPAAMAARAEGATAASADSVTDAFARPEPTIFATKEPTPSTMWTSASPALTVAATASTASRDDADAISPKLGEYLAAPWVAPALPAARGRILGSGDLSAMRAMPVRRGITLRERVLVSPPTSAAPSVGDRYVAFRQDAALRGDGVVLVPTGVLIADRIEGDGAVAAHVAAVYGELAVGQPIVPLTLPVIDSTTRPLPIVDGPWGRVAWISGGGAELPTLLSYLVVRGSSGAFRVGDQLTLQREEPNVSPSPKGPGRGEEIAIARVLRVSDGAATAIVLHQSQPAIRIGTLARVSARIP